MEASNEDILEGNKLIAEFMGAKSLPYLPFDLRGCKYHSSWDWLKPVVDKIFTYGLVHQNEVKKVSGMSIVINITSCWRRVVEFIKWYNQNKD